MHTEKNVGSIIRQFIDGIQGVYPYNRPIHPPFSLLLHLDLPWWRAAARCTGLDNNEHILTKQTNKRTNKQPYVQAHIDTYTLSRWLWWVWPMRCHTMRNPVRTILPSLCCSHRSSAFLQKMGFAAKCDQNRRFEKVTLKVTVWTVVMKVNSSSLSLGQRWRYFVPQNFSKTYETFYSFAKFDKYCNLFAMRKNLAMLRYAKS